MVIARALPCVLFSALALVGCGQETKASLTEIVVVIDTDLAVPDQIDEIEVIAIGPNGAEKKAYALLGKDAPMLPRTVGLVHEAGPLSPLNITVAGRRKDKLVLKREATLAFLKGRTLVLPMHLVSSCLGVVCDEGETCTERRCDDARIDPESLDAWSGDKPRLELDDGGGHGTDGGMDKPDGGGSIDASMPTDGGGNGGTDSGMCMPKAETCNGLDDDCNDKIDEGFDLSTDPQNCRECGVVCRAPRRKCCDGVCEINC